MTCAWGHQSGAPHVVGYVRVSMAREEMISPELQTAAIEDYCRRKGYHLGEVIEDLDKSGRNFARAGIQAAIEKVENAGVAAVVVWKFSRFGRNRLGNAVNLDRVEAAGGRLESATEEVDATTAIGKFTRGMLNELAAFESDRIGETWQETHAHRRAMGLPHHGKPAFGYIYHRATKVTVCPQGCEPGECDTGYVPHPENGPILRRMYLSYNAGRSFEKIAAWLNDQGAQSVAGEPWDARKVRRVLDSGFGAGWLRVHNAGCRCKSPADCSNKTLAPGAQTSVITSAEWDVYQAQRKSRAGRAPRVESPVYPLAGLVGCGRCKGRLNAHPHIPSKKQGRIPGYLYVCRTWAKSRGCVGTWITRAKVESAVLKWLADEAAPELERRAAGVAAHREERAVRGQDRERLTRESVALDKALTQLTIDKAKGLIPESAYVTARDELLADQAKLGERLEMLKGEEEMAAAVPVEVAEGLIEEWETLPPDARRAMLGKLVKDVTVTSEGKGKALISIAPMWGGSPWTVTV
ncbi:recombinase family protein [Nonomuraea sp. NPDC003560]|uniref:recombinase family protein n=1 Tax=Nonomuraea sp. NPDC003560 TaxID=3364341 RepID=UPI0036833BB5